MNGASRDRLLLLDSLRGLAALFVMLYHVEHAFDLTTIFSRGYLFVDFFFLLSGFVLTLSAEPKMQQGLGAFAFTGKRIVRLWPVMTVGIVIGALHHMLTGHGADTVQLLAAGLLMIPVVWQGGTIFPLNSPQWSLMLELLANLMHGLLLRHLRDGHLLLLAVLFGVVFALTVMQFGSNTLGPFAFNWWYALPRVAFSYTLGVWIGRRWQAGAFRSQMSWKVALLLPAAALLILPRLPLSVALGDIAVVVALFPPMLWFAAGSEVQTAAQSWLDRIGKLSFPLYAVHLPLIDSVANLGKTPSVMLLAIACPIAVAALVAHWMEPKARSRKIGSALPAA
jgi:peptidoglycan/LPS O-acetylase OafA/YrhL